MAVAVWACWILFAGWWIANALRLLMKRRQDPAWEPSGVQMLNQASGLHLSTPQFIGLMVVSATLFTLTGFWLPHDLIVFIGRP